MANVEIDLVEAANDPDFQGAMKVVDLCKAEGWTPDDAVLRLVAALGYCSMSSTTRTHAQLIDFAVEALKDLKRRFPVRKVPS